VLGNVSTVALDHGRLWLVPPDDQVKTLTDFGEVAAIYGWNYDGSKLLFGRGLYETRGEFAKATELWVYDAHSEEAYRLVDSRQIWSASWSPVDDRVAYCEYGETPTLFVISLDGKVQHKHADFFPDFAWSPDGTAIAVPYSGPEMHEFDTNFTVLGIWWLEKDELQLLNDAIREDHSYPIWTIDGNHVIFHRSFGPGSAEGEDGLYIADITTSKMSLYPNDPEYAASGLMRSPKGDFFLYQLGYDIYVIDYGKEPILIGKGSKPVWLPDGKNVLYNDERGQIQIVKLNFPVKNQVIGGNFSAITIHLQPDIYFKMGGSK